MFSAPNDVSSLFRGILKHIVDQDLIATFIGTSYCLLPAFSILEIQYQTNAEVARKKTGNLAGISSPWGLWMWL